MQNDTGAADRAARNEASADVIIPYKETPQAELNLHRFDAQRDSDAPVPAIAFFFGGGWVSWSPTQFYPFAKRLAALGLQVYCAEYRIESKHDTDPRCCVTDAVSALRYLREHADSEGIDPDRLAAGGGSAGGHLAASIATCSGLENPSENSDTSYRPNALALFNPVYDNGPGAWGHERVKDYWESFSPLHNISEMIPPSFVVLGSEDDFIPVSTAQDWKERCEAVGAYSELHIYEGMGHGFFNYGNEAFDDCANKLEQFFKQLNWI